MNNERKFRAATALLLVTAMSISVYHRHKAERIGGARAPAWQEEGWPLAVALRAFGFAMWLGVADSTDQPALDALVEAESSAVPALDGGGDRVRVPAAVLQDLQQPRRERHPDGRHEERPQARHHRPLPLGAASPLLGGSGVRRRPEPPGGELVHDGVRHHGPHAAVDAPAERGGGANRTLRRRVSAVRRTHRTAVLALPITPESWALPNPGSPTYSFDLATC